MLALVFLSVSALHTFSYAAIVIKNIIKKNEKYWIAGIEYPNKINAILIVLLALFINTPVLDPVRTTANNQISRLAQGTVSAENFDYAYLKFKLGKYGKQALEKIAAMKDHEQYAVIEKKLRETEQMKYYTHVNPEIGFDDVEITILPAGKEIPLEVKQYLLKTFRWEIQNQRCENGCTVIVFNADDDKEDEYIYLGQSNNIYAINIIDFKENSTSCCNITNMRITNGKPVSRDKIINLVKQGKLGKKPVTIFDLTIGEHTFSKDRQY